MLPCALLVSKGEPTWGGPGAACVCVTGRVLVWRCEGVGGGLPLDETQVLGVQQRQAQHAHQARVADEREDLQHTRRGETEAKASGAKLLSAGSCGPEASKTRGAHFVFFVLRGGTCWHVT